MLAIAYAMLLGVIESSVQAKDIELTTDRGKARMKARLLNLRYLISRTRSQISKHLSEISNRFSEI
jgi:hypothetical protein